MLVAVTSAVEPWAVRAAELFSVPILRIAVGTQIGNSTADLTVNISGSSEINCDWLVTAFAHRIDCVYVRRKGRIERCLRARVGQLADASTRVALTNRNDCAALRLMTDGAVGWLQLPSGANTDHVNHLPSAQLSRPHAGDSLPLSVTPTQSTETNEDNSDDSWVDSAGEWLIHCTRSCVGAWPDETPEHYVDSMLLGDESVTQREPLDVLLRIIRKRRLFASAIATNRSYPVACFSELSLRELLMRRCFRSHLKRWDYEPFGIALKLEAAKSAGALPVIYADRPDRAAIVPEDQFRFHPLGAKIDWAKEKEWRFSGDVFLDDFHEFDVRVFAQDSSESRRRLCGSPWPVHFLPVKDPVTEANHRVGGVSKLGDAV